MRYNLLVLSLIFFYSCNSDLKRKEVVVSDSTKIKKIYYTDGKIKIEYQAFDSIINGRYTEYYQNGRIKEEFYCKMGKKMGWDNRYYSNGILSYKTYYKENEKERKFRTEYYYYLNGKLESILNLRFGKAFGDAYFYYSNGKIKAYNAFDFNGNSSYVLLFDSLGNKTKEEGIAFSPDGLSSFPSDSTILNRPDTIQLSVSAPPNTKTIITIGEIDINGKLRDTQNYPINNFKITYIKTFTKVGKCKIRVTGKILNKDDKVINEDSRDFDFIVR